MNFCIRADSSIQTGTGHVMRCLALAEELRESGGRVFFVCRDLPGNINDLIRDRGFEVKRLPDAKDYVVLADAVETLQVLKEEKGCINWLVVDHYRIDEQWEQCLRPHVRRIMVLDDLADRKHDCDLLLDQNLCDGFMSRYDALVPKYCIKMLGPRYALLRNEFKSARGALKNRDGIIKRILVFFGGTDPTDETSKTIEAVSFLNRPDITFDVIVGKGNPYREKVMSLSQPLPNINYYCQVENMAEFMANADLAVGAGGTATWERCFLGLPSVLTIIAENQRQNAHALDAVGAALNLGWHADISPKDIASVIEYLVSNPLKVREMAKNSFEIMKTGSLKEDLTLLGVLTEGKHDSI